MSLLIYIICHKSAMQLCLSFFSGLSFFSLCSFFWQTLFLFKSSFREQTSLVRAKARVLVSERGGVLVKVVIG